MNDFGSFNLPSVMTHDFARVPRADIPRSSFDRSHGLKTNIEPSALYPIFVDEVLPGDTFNLSMTGFARLATQIAPTMDNLYFNTFFFFVPYRLVWDNWEKFNGAQDNPGDSTDFRIPTITSDGGTGFLEESIYDYMGLPTDVGGLEVSALPLRAYNLIWNEWFRDENLQNSLPVHKGDGPDPLASYHLRRRGKRHDYFTSSLPWPQKGTQVNLPLGTTAPVVPVDANSVPSFKAGGLSNIGLLMNAGTDNTTWGQVINPTGGYAAWDQTRLQVDLNHAYAATINQLREAFQIQRLYERDARSGTRYTEILKAHFGVSAPDFRLQRPEYLGGGQSDVNVYQVPQTSSSVEGQPQGSLAAYGTSVLNNHGFNKSFVEHGIIIGLVCVRADLTYQQGLNRMWSRRKRFDFYWPALSALGEQVVYNKEIFCDGSPADNDVWGYQERYAEYRYKPSQITASMRSTAALSLDIWHLSQHFETRPHLNSTFIEEHVPIERVIAVNTEPAFICDFYFKLRCARPMPIYGVPGGIDHL